MREANRRRIWAKALAQLPAIELRALEIDEHPLFAPQRIALARRITVICGRNGLGKTRLTDLICGLCGGIAQPGNVTARLECNRSQGRRRETFVLPEAQETVSVEVLEPAVLVSWHLGQLEPLGDDVDDLLEQYSPKDLGAQFAKDVAWVLRRSYSRIEVFDLSDLENDDETLPYFRVTAGGMTYEQREMGRGEHAAFLILWRLQQIAENSWIVLEEPETFLSPGSQRRLLDVVVRESLGRNMGLVITTHSPDMLAEVPIDSVLLATRDGARVRISQSVRESDLREEVGLSIPFRGVLVVEDDMAKLVLETIMQVLRFRHSKEYLIEPIGSDGNVSKAAEFAAARRKSLHQVSILDGGQDKLPVGLAGPILRLPGGASPEEVLIAHAVSNSEMVAKGFQIDLAQVRAAFDAAEGADLHEWSGIIAGRLQINADELMRFICREWVAANAGECRVLLDDIEAAAAALPS